MAGAAGEPQSRTMFAPRRLGCPYTVEIRLSGGTKDKPLHGLMCPPKYFAIGSK